MILELPFLSTGHCKSYLYNYVCSMSYHFPPDLLVTRELESVTQSSSKSVIQSSDTALFPSFKIILHSVVFLFILYAFRGLV